MTRYYKCIFLSLLSHSCMSHRGIIWHWWNIGEHWTSNCYLCNIKLSYKTIKMTGCLANNIYIFYNRGNDHGMFLSTCLVYLFTLSIWYKNQYNTKLVTSSIVFLLLFNRFINRCVDDSCMIRHVDYLLEYTPLRK